MKEYTVIRMHYGDKLYKEGDTRECDERTADALIKNGLIAENKSQPAPKNKAKQTPQNKSK